MSLQMRQMVKGDKQHVSYNIQVTLGSFLPINIIVSCDV